MDSACYLTAYHSIEFEIFRNIGWMHADILLYFHLFVQFHEVWYIYNIVTKYGWCFDFKQYLICTSFHYAIQVIVYLCPLLDKEN